MKPVDVDPHLRAALRHAPDADLEAPPQVSALIMAAARHSAAQRRTAGAAATAGPTLARLRSNLTSWRPTRWGASGALATVLMAGFIGLLWRGEPPAPVRDGPAPGSARLPSPAAVPVAPEAMPATAPAPALDQPAAKPALKATQKAASGETEARRTQADATAGHPGRRTERPDKQAAGQTVDGSMQTNAPPSPEGATVARDTAAEARRRESPSEGPAPAATRNSHAMPTEAVASVPPLPATDAAAGAVVAPAARRATAPAPARAPATSPAGLAAGPNAGLAAVAAPPWRLPPQPGDLLQWLSPDPLRPPDAAWLALLEQLARGQWQAQPGAAGVPPPSAQVLQLEWRRGDRLVGQLWLSAAGALWCGAMPPCERAALKPEAHRELLAALKR